jgi:hypothetical protein
MHVCQRSLFSASDVNDTGDKFISGINDTTDQGKSMTKINRQCR